MQLNYFLKEKFENFGTYQDAITKDIKQNFLFHSNISSSLNIGLLDLNELINKIVDFDAPYNAKRRIYTTNYWLARVYASIYEDNGVILRNSNFFEFKNAMPKR